MTGFTSTMTRRPLILLAAGAATGCVWGCQAGPQAPSAPPKAGPGEVVIESPAGTPRPPFTFNESDAKFLEDIQRGCFNFFWNTADAASGMVPDRTSKPGVVSIAGVGFELAAMVIGDKHGWVSPELARERTVTILRALAANPRNRKHGMFYHFVSATTAGPDATMPEDAVSTIDSALFFAGAMVASQHFGGEAAAIADTLLAEADWHAFVMGDSAKPYERGFISLGWKPASINDPNGEGHFLPYGWIDAADEHRLVTFLAVAAPDAARGIPPQTYYALRRPLGEYHNSGPVVWLPWSGAHFTNFFAHLWIDWSRQGVDNPAAFGVQHRARVDWWENSRRMTRLQRDKAIAKGKENPAFGENAWGVTASDIPGGYGVPGVYPAALPQSGRLEFDYVTFKPKEDFGDGTLAPYGAGCSILFEPTLALAALRHYRELKAKDGSPLAWRDPSHGDFGFVDAFNTAKDWAAADTLSIDQGPLLVAIENARTGMVWDLFAKHPVARAGAQKLGWKDAR